MTGLSIGARLDEKVEALELHLRALGPVAVAMSGGVDSSFLLAATCRAGLDTVALLGVSPTLSQASRERAHRVSECLEVPIFEVPTREMDNPSYLANGVDRCYHCKRELYGVFQGLISSLGGSADAVSPALQRDRVLLDGTQADDRRDSRPGRQAAREQGVQSPLLELGWTKEEIREVSRVWKLETAELPGGPCLSSRVPIGTAVTLGALTRVETAEAALRRLGFGEVRVRDHGSLARIELPTEQLIALLTNREAVIEAASAAGYDDVTVDLRGYRPSGSRPASRVSAGQQAEEIERSER